MRRLFHSEASNEKLYGTVSISERAAAIEDRAVPGHWEGGWHNCGGYADHPWLKRGYLSEKR